MSNSVSKSFSNPSFLILPTLSQIRIYPPISPSVTFTVSRSFAGTGNNLAILGSAKSIVLQYGGQSSSQSMVPTFLLHVAFIPDLVTVTDIVLVVDEELPVSVYVLILPLVEGVHPEGIDQL